MNAGRAWCPLCLASTDLIRSHIIPAFCYDAAFDEKHRVLHLDAARATAKPRQSGIWEPLLCAACDGFLNRYDSYFATIWSTPPIPDPLLTPQYEIRSLDYRLFKLFHLSVLWRAHWSTHKAFASVRLGPHESRIRAVLKTGDAGAAGVYPIWATCVVRETLEIERQLLVPHQPTHLSGHRFYVSMFGGCEWLIKISRHPWSNALSGNLSSTGRLTVHRRPRAALNYVHRFTAQFKENESHRNA